MIWTFPSSPILADDLFFQQSFLHVEQSLGPMDVLKPQLIYIDGRCYRKNPVQQKETEPYTEEDEYFEPEDDIYADELCDDDVNIEQTGNGYKVRMAVPSAYFKYIIGKKAEMKRKLEHDTKTQIWIPRQGEKGNIVINGRDRKGVLSAKSRIEILVDSARARQPFTHFLSFPVHFEQLQGKFAEFKDIILEDCKGDRGIDSTIFQNPSKLHITLGILALMDDSEVDHAIGVLQQCQSDLIPAIVGTVPMVGHFRGLEYMNDDPGEVDVLYGMVELQDGSDRFQMLADRIVDKFVSAGLMTREYDRVKLHVTLMNTLMRKDPNGAFVPRSSDRRPPMKDRESFDATGIFRKHGKFDFGTYKIGEIHLSQRHGSGCDGYYACAAKIQLP